MTLRLRYHISLLLAALAFFAFTAAPAIACDCTQQTDMDGFKQWPLVFTATTEQVVAHRGEMYISTTVVTPQKFFKGSTTINGQFDPFYNDSDCAFRFEPGKRYLIFAEAENSIRLKASICSPTREITADFEPDPVALVSPEMLAEEPMKIEDADLVCDADQQCITTQTECGCQQCPTVINNQRGALYDTIHKARCAEDRLLKCDVYCPGTVACMQQRCTWLPAAK